MIETFLLKIKERYPNLKETPDEVSDACTIKIPWAKKVNFQDEKNRIDIQTYDAKDANIGYIEIDNQDTFILPVEGVIHDMSWLFQLEGTSELDPKENYLHKEWTNKLTAEQYVVLYTSLEEHIAITKPDFHRIFFFTLNSSWLKRYSNLESKRFLEISKHLYGKEPHSYSSKILTMRTEINVNIKRILEIDPSYEGLELDKEIYNYVVKLIGYSKEDLDSHIIFTNYTAQRLLKNVHKKIDEYTKDGKEAVKVKHIVDEFNVSQQYLYRIHVEEFGYSLNILSRFVWNWLKTGC